MWPGPHLPRVGPGAAAVGDTVTIEMFRPVGTQPPSVYWRRRLLFLGTVLVLLVLIVITARVLLGGDGAAAPPGAGSSDLLSTATQPAPSTGSSSTTQHSTTPASHTGSESTSRSGSATTTPPPQRCVLAALAVRATADHTSYSVGDKPHLMLQVTNTGTVACVQDLADPQIELLVYNGESRVWGSHDCKILSGTNDMTLPPNAPVRVTVIWSGLSSNVNSAHTAAACGPRQVVGAGTYTLYAKLHGKTGQAAQFSIS